MCFAFRAVILWQVYLSILSQAIDKRFGNQRCPTMRAPDLGYAPRFLGFFWLERNPVSTASPHSHPKRVTRAVRQPRAKTKKSLNRKFGFVAEFKKANSFWGLVNSF